MIPLVEPVFYAVDHAVDTEEEAFACAKRFLSYLPPSVYELPPRGEQTDDPDRKVDWLIDAIPRDIRKVYKMRPIIEAVVEKVEIKHRVYATIDAARRPGSIVSSNTSTIPLASLLEGMTAHFQAIPSARSVIESAEVSGRYVVVRERALWDGPDGAARTRSSLSIYEIREGRVSAVWYFPSER